MMIEPMTIAGARLLLSGVSVGFPNGGDAKAGGRTIAPPGEARAMPVTRG